MNFTNTCKTCGEEFQADAEWKTQCVPCYIKSKGGTPFKKKNGNKSNNKPSIETVELLDVLQDMADSLKAILVEMRNRA